MEKIVLGLGSNQGNMLGFLQTAVELLSEFISDVKVSSVYVTKPQDFSEQPDFFNIVLFGKYEGSPESLLEKTQKIELKLGRERNKAIPKGPRTIDIDILIFGEKTVNTKKLTIPHPAIKKRQFVLIPMLEIFPNYAEPITKVPYKKFLNQLEDQGVKKLGSLWEPK